MGSVHVVLPNDIDDPTSPSGGNAYDRRLCLGLADLGWSVREHAVRGAWPSPLPAERAELAGVLAAVPDGAIVLLDGLIASAVPDVLVPEARRLRLVVLVHMPLGAGRDDAAEAGAGADAAEAGADAAGAEAAPEAAADAEAGAEAAALGTARAVVTTSAWTRRRLVELYGLPPDRVHAVTPGVDRAPLAPASDAGSRLLCVAAVAPHKGHDLLIRALAAISDLPYGCLCVGTLTRDPDFVGRLRRMVDDNGLTERIRFAGTLTGDDLDAAYAAADLLVLPSRGETYGMVVTEALARGIPVLATAVKGLPESLGRAPDGSPPGMLVNPHDLGALSRALRSWLSDADLRRRLRSAARARRTTLTGWDVTARLVSDVLAEVHA